MSENWRSLYPFASHEFKIDALRYHYLDEGGGQPLLMVHGNPTWSFYWRNLVRAFRDQYRVVVPDHLGCGLSDKPQDYQYRLSNHIDNLVRLVEHLDLQQITLMVHDWGGAIGLGAALQFPHRIARLVLFNTGAYPPPFIPLRIRLCRTPLIGQWAIRRLNLFARAALWMAVEHPDRMTPDVCAGLLAPYDTWQHRIATYRFVADIPMTRRHPTWETLQDIEAGLATLADKPTKIIWGMKDWCFTPQCLERFRQHFPDADVSQLHDAGHYVIEDAHEVIVPILREFLGNDDRG